MSFEEPAEEFINDHAERPLPPIKPSATPERSRPSGLNASGTYGDDMAVNDTLSRPEPVWQELHRPAKGPSLPTGKMLVDVKPGTTVLVFPKPRKTAIAPCKFIIDPNDRNEPAGDGFPVDPPMDNGRGR